MATTRMALVACGLLFYLLPLCLAKEYSDYNGCIVYKTVTKYTSTDTFTWRPVKYVGTTTSTDFWWYPTVSEGHTKTETFRTASTATVLSGTSNSYDRTTVIRPQYGHYTTKSCPAGPDYVRRCSKATTTTETDTRVSASYVGLNDTITRKATEYTHTTLLSTVQKQTTTLSGNPPRTKVVTKTIYRSTSYYDYTTTTTSTSYTKTVTTTRKSIAFRGVRTISVAPVRPTETGTITLFSLQVSNTTSELDGKAVSWDRYGSLVAQNQSFLNFFISPNTGYLREVSTGYTLRSTQYCGGEEPPCGTGMRFVPLKELDDDWAGDVARCRVACGGVLKCRDDWNGRFDFVVVNYGREILPYLAPDWDGPQDTTGLPKAKLLAVGPRGEPVPWA